MAPFPKVQKRSYDGSEAQHFFIELCRCVYASTLHLTVDVLRFPDRNESIWSSSSRLFKSLPESSLDIESQDSGGTVTSVQLIMDSGPLLMIDSWIRFIFLNRTIHLQRFMYSCWSNNSKTIRLCWEESFLQHRHHREELQCSEWKAGWPNHSEDADPVGSQGGLLLVGFDRTIYVFGQNFPSLEWSHLEDKNQLQSKSYLLNI